MRPLFICFGVFVLSIFLFLMKLHGQQVGLHKAKYPDERGRLYIQVDSFGQSNKYSVNCFAGPLVHLSDSLKMHLIKKLLNYEKDTSLCVWPVRQLHALVYQRGTPISKEYRIQVEALLLINLLAFGSDFFVYSPFPVLQNIGTGKEIGNDQKTISKVYLVYKDWFKRMKVSNKGFTYPDLQKIGIKWFGLKTSSKKFRTMGKWSPYFDCPEIE